MEPLRRKDDIDFNAFQRQKLLTMFTARAAWPSFNPLESWPDAQAVLHGVKKRCSLPEVREFVTILKAEICAASGYGLCTAYGMLFGLTPHAITTAAVKFAKYLKDRQPNDTYHVWKRLKEQEADG